MKKICAEKYRKMFLEEISFAFKKNFFIALHDIIGLHTVSHCLSANHNPELRSVICTGVTLFALVLHSQPNRAV